jgi:peptidoglycan/LPS O-acetylase OafA/YrhL
MRVVLLYAAQNTAGAFVFTPCQVDALAMGALLAVLVRERERTVATMAWPLILVGGLAWVACCVDKNLLLTAGVTAFSGMSAGLLAACLYHPLAALFFNAALRAFGKYSYAIYVFHTFVLSLILPLRDTWGLPIFTLVFIALSFSAGWLSWHLYEKYFLRLKRFFPAGTSSVESPVLLA